jgi:hypothetical protein
MSKKVYNPPPNWPPAPEGWTPPPGWQPDPAWGPPPEGWQLWVESEQRNWFSRHKVLTGIGAVVVLIIGISLASSNSGTETSSDRGGGNASSPPVASSAPTSTPKAAPTTSAPTTRTSTPTPTAAPVRPVTYKGRGNKVLTIKKPEQGPVLITTTVRGPDDNFTIYALDADLNEGDLLVNTIGSYTGTSILDKFEGDETRRLKIQGSGSWTVTLKPLAAARSMTTSVSGKGDDVILYRGPSGVATVTNRGPEDNFTVYFYGSDGEDLLVNDIGNFSGETTIKEGPGFLEVDGGGSWSIKVSP